MHEPDRWKSGPPDDHAMLSWFEGIYSHAFVALHPFVQIEGLDPKRCNYETPTLRRGDVPADIDLVKWMDAEGKRRATGKEFDAEAVDLAAKRFGEKVSWRTLCDRAGFADHTALDRALRTRIGGLKVDYEDRAGAERLAQYCREHRIFLPSEGNFPPILQHRLAELFRRSGIRELMVADEFGDVERLLPLSTVDQDTPWDGEDHLIDYGVRRMFASDRSLFAWVHWDSFFTVIFGTEASMRDADVARLFEGFWCSGETSVYWLNQPAQPLAG